MAESELRDLIAIGWIIRTAKRGPGVSPMRGSGTVITFGRYDGWSIDRIAKHDPDYLRWLGRHSAGLRYRSEIEKTLATVSREPTYSERMRTR